MEPQESKDEAREPVAQQADGGEKGRMGRILTALQKGQHVIVLTDAILTQKEKQREKMKNKNYRVLEPEKLQWKPPVFSAASRTWNW